MPNTYVRIGGSWKRINKKFVRVNGVWKELTNSYIRIGGFWKKIFTMVIPGSVTYSTIGNHTFIVPAHNTLTVNCNGSGGGTTGWNRNSINGNFGTSSLVPRLYNVDPTPYDGSLTYFYSNVGNHPRANYGNSAIYYQPYTGGWPIFHYFPNNHPGGLGGFAAGGNINIPGIDGGACLSDANTPSLIANPNHGRGGGSPNGGATILTSIANNIVSASINGNFPGGGAAGIKARRAISGFQVDSNYKNPGGGGGGFASRTYEYNTFNIGQNISLVVGKPGLPLHGNTFAGGSGANGRIIVSWN